MMFTLLFCLGRLSCLDPSFQVPTMNILVWTCTKFYNHPWWLPSNSCDICCHHIRLLLCSPSFVRDSALKIGYDARINLVKMTSRMSITCCMGNSTFRAVIITVSCVIICEAKLIRIPSDQTNSQVLRR